MSFSRQRNETDGTQLSGKPYTEGHATLVEAAADDVLACEAPLVAEESLAGEVAVVDDLLTPFVID